MASQFIFDAIGTRWTIDIDTPITKEQEEVLFTRITHRIGIFDKAYSRFREDSLVTAMSQSAGRFILPDDAQAMLTLYRKLYDVTLGLVTPLIGQVLVDAGYDAKYSLSQQRPLSHPPLWDNVITYKHPHIDINAPVLLDFGALGKGYLIDLIGQVLEEASINSFCIDAGGDILYMSKKEKPLAIGLEHPDDSSKVIGSVLIMNQSLCGSAGNRRRWGDFHHIINPHTLTSPKHVIAVWAIADTAMIADAMTTALFFSPVEVLTKHFDFEYFILNADYSFEKSGGFKAEIFS